MATQSNTKTLSAEDFDKIEKIRKENEVLKANLSSKTKECDAKTKENEVLKANLSSKTKECDAKTKENEVLKANLSSKTKENEGLTANLSSKTNENSLLKKTVEQITNDNQKMNTTLREIGKLNEDVKKEYNELKSIDYKRLITLDWAYKILVDAPHAAKETTNGIKEQAQYLQDVIKEVAKGIHESGDIS